MQFARLAQTSRSPGSCRPSPWAGAILGAIGVGLPALAVPTLIPLGSPRTGNNLTLSYGAPAGGGAVVGSTLPLNGGTGEEAFLWSANGGMIGLSDLLGTAGGRFERHSQANGVSVDGNVVVGESLSSQGGTQAFRWTTSGGIVGLGYLAGGSSESRAFGVSADGGVVVGGGRSASGAEAFRWTENGGMIGLGDLPGGVFSSAANAVSADGNVVVGYGRSSSGIEAFRWTESGGMIGLGDFAGRGFHSEALGVSADGSIVVGMGVSASGPEAFLWSPRDGMIGLGDLPGGFNDVQFESQANGVSADGGVVVGFGTSASGREAFVWTPSGGMISLWNLLQTRSVNPTSGNWSALIEATGISSDGRYVAGYGTHNGNTEAFLLDFGAASVPEPNAYWAAGALLAWRAFAWRSRRPR